MPDIQQVPPETAALRAALEAAQRTGDSERARARELEGRLRAETGNRFAAQETAIDTAMAQTETVATSRQQHWAELQAEGKFEEAGQAMREMSDATARLTQLRGQKEWLAQQKQVAAQPQTVDPLANFNTAERDWISHNPRYLEDPSFMRKANAAAQHAELVLGVAKDSPEYYQHIEKTMYPERDTQRQSEDGEGRERQIGDGAAPFSDTGGEGDGGGDGSPLEQQHNMPITVNPATVDAPAMRIDLGSTPDTPQQRAVGRGGGGVSAVAAPPSRRIAEAAQRLGRSSRIEPTMEELQTARALAESIEPDIARRGDEDIIRWYYAMYNSPTHRSTRRRHWVYPDGRAA